MKPAAPCGDRFLDEKFGVTTRPDAQDWPAAQNLKYGAGSPVLCVMPSTGSTGQSLSVAALTDSQTRPHELLPSGTWDLRGAPDPYPVHLFPVVARRDSISPGCGDTCLRREPTYRWGVLILDASLSLCQIVCCASVGSGHGRLYVAGDDRDDAD
jgi:hypothetical protein